MKLVLASCERQEILWEDAWRVAVPIAGHGLLEDSDVAGELNKRMYAIEPILERAYRSRVAAQRLERESIGERERRYALE